MPLMLLLVLLLMLLLMLLLLPGLLPRAARTPTSPGRSSVPTPGSLAGILPPIVPLSSEEGKSQLVMRPPVACRPADITEGIQRVGLGAQVLEEPVLLGVPIRALGRGVPPALAAPAIRLPRLTRGGKRRLLRPPLAGTPTLVPFSRIPASLSASSIMQDVHLIGVRSSPDSP
jgi:hypothetical protein